MAWIREIAYEESTGTLRQVYDSTLAGGRGQAPEVSPIVSVMSLRPDALNARLRLSRAVTFGGSGLGRRLEELIAVAISGMLNCEYCSTTHGRFLREHGNATSEEADQVRRNWRAAKLSESERAVLEFCEKLTFQQSQMTENDVQRLRDVGFDDKQILSIVLAAAYRHFITRVADALGVRETTSETQEPPSGP